IVSVHSLIRQVNLGDERDARSGILGDSATSEIRQNVVASVLHGIRSVSPRRRCVGEGGIAGCYPRDGKGCGSERVGENPAAAYIDFVSIAVVEARGPGPGLKRGFNRFSILVCQYKGAKRSAQRIA